MYINLRSMPNQNPEHKEGKTAKKLEEQTAKISSDIFLWAALGTITLSLAFFCTKNKLASIFIAQLAPCLLIMGLYNKLVKTEGHDDAENKASVA